MIKLIPGTTPTVTLKFGSTSDFSDISNVWITFKNKITEKSYYKRFELDDISIDNDKKTMTVTFSQEESLKMNGLTSVEVQVRIKYTTDNKIFGTYVKSLPVSRVLEGGVM